MKICRHDHYESKWERAQKDIHLQYRGKKTEVDLISKIQIDMVLDENDVLRVISTIKKQAGPVKQETGKYSSLLSR
ncbi:P-II family nitrogen regulator [Methanohalophilus mahii]|uniref:Nitrogen regulatory protein P-II n=1 Tax=Methanohalophilus mahii (strain ATCC 35705 / DSM 5219 / SLP) TaxID=547558 RepID=D5EAT1_METMS|nr:P-II family nitrogen regulator [Methanohalophilus mahii]ADE36282.1 nitrogen regulatory protein P-II [Methanohalophilus mahii DSM 5219]